MSSQIPAQLPSDSSTILERSRGVFFAQWEELLRLRRAVLKTADPDDIHDLRVASRRFRALLELFGPITPKASKTGLKKNIRALTQVLGGLRNIDEALHFFESQIQASTDIQHAFSQQRSKELKLISKALEAFDFRSLDKTVRKMIAGLTADCLKELNRFSLLSYFSDVSIRQSLPIHNLLAVSTSPENYSSRHALRIAIKKWRYFLEIVAQVLDRNYTPVLEMLKEYQSVLGRMNDIIEFRALLGNLELPVEDQKSLKAILLTEDALLLENFKALMERKPLVYAFSI